MADEVFKNYQARGAISREDFIFSKEFRDAHPFTCKGEEFTRGKKEVPEEWVDFSLIGLWFLRAVRLTLDVSISFLEVGFEDQ